MAHLGPDWHDPYDHDSNESADERDPGDDDVMHSAHSHPSSPPYAQQQPRQQHHGDPQAYSASPPAARSQRVWEGQFAGRGPLMYSPGSTHLQHEPPGAGVQLQQQYGGREPPRPVNSPAARVMGRAAPEPVPAPAPAPGEIQHYPNLPYPQDGRAAVGRVGVGVMLDGSGDIHPGLDFHDSLRGPYDLQQQLRSSQQRLPRGGAAVRLPPPKEGQPVMPPPHIHSIEPPRPAPRRSRRYLKYAIRTPDICEGQKISPVLQGHHVVQCDSCHTPSQVPRMCVLLKCPKCRHVSSAMTRMQIHKQMR